MVATHEYEEVRIIKTGRSQDEINLAVEEGFWPVVVRVTPNLKITSHCAVFQHIPSGKIQVISDYRLMDRYRNASNYKQVLGMQSYYPYGRRYPFAAYLIPPDLKVNERVYLEDVIEDVIEGHSNQGLTFRLNSAYAIWNGKRFVIEFNPESDVKRYVG